MTIYIQAREEKQSYFDPKKQEVWLVDEIIADVHGQIIPYADLELAYAEYLEMRKKDEAKLSKADIFQKIFTRTLFLAKAYKEELEIDEAELKQTIDDNLNYQIKQAGSKKNLEKYYEQTVEQIRRKLQKNYKENMLIQKYQKKILDTVYVNPKEALQFFQSIPKKELIQIPLQVVCRELVIYPAINLNQKKEIKQKLSKLKQRILDGDPFQLLATVYSEDESTKANAGELGFWELGTLDPVYEATVLNLEPSEISDPVETEVGFYLIQLLEKKEYSYNTRHILIRYDLENLDLEAAQKKAEEIYQKIIEKKISFSEAVTKYSQDQKSVMRKGTLVNHDQSSYLTLEECPEEIRSEINKLSRVELIPPRLVHTLDQKPVIKIFLVDKKITPHQLSFTEDYDLIIEMALEKKKEAIMEEKIKALRKELCIKIKPEYDQFI